MKRALNNTNVNLFEENFAMVQARVMPLQFVDVENPDADLKNIITCAQRAYLKTIPRVIQCAQYEEVKKLFLKNVDGLLVELLNKVVYDPHITDEIAVNGENAPAHAAVLYRADKVIERILRTVEALSKFVVKGEGHEQVIVSQMLLGYTTSKKDPTKDPTDRLQKLLVYLLKMVKTAHRYSSCVRVHTFIHTYTYIETGYSRHGYITITT